MRALKIICGIAVILVSLHMVHGIHHFLHMAGENGMHGAPVWAMIAAAGVVDVLACVGGVFLLIGKA